MKKILYILVFIQLLFANPQFSNDEKSVFGNNPQNEEVQTKEIITYEQEENLTDTTLNQETNKFFSTTNTPSNTKPVISQENNEQNISSQLDTVLNKQEELGSNVLQHNEQNDEEQSEQSTQSNEEMTLSSNEEEFIELFEPIDYFTKVEFENNQSKSLYLSYLHYPKNIYKNQRFEVVLKALLTTEGNYSIETRFLNAVNMTVLNPDNLWVPKENSTYENRFYFKAYADAFVMPTFQVLIYKEAELVETALIQPEELNFTQIAKDDDKFSSVIAKSLRVNAYKTKQYNNNELITILDIEANESNLEDFNLRYIEEQGFSKISDNYPEQSMLYYLVMPIHKKKIEFNYYNTKMKRFEKIEIPIVLDNELVSTQTDLNPNNSNLLLYKKIALSVLTILFLGLFIWKRKYYYLVLFMLTLIVLILYLMPNKQAFVKNNTTIYILPTKNSTIFYKTKKVNVVQVVMKKEHFVKIMMNHNNKKIIGWIKEDKLVTN